MGDKASPLVDSHCHLVSSQFDDLDAVCERMRQARVLQAVVVATGVSTARSALSLCGEQAGLFPTAGIHPNDLTEDWEREFAEIEELVAAGGFVGVGESGLDYFRERAPHGRQRAALERHAALACARDLPLIVHVRERDGRLAAFDDAAAALAAFPGLRGVMHCYSGDAAHAERYLALGLSISFSGVLTFPGAHGVRAVAAALPLSAVLVETDAPYLAPQPWRGTRNEPAYVVATAAALAEVKGVSEEEARRATTRNSRLLFGLPDAD
ncbi:MAG: TatD family hydrolase [Planctomycetes bacterium]|nr:TatD family hydrolase [Planctomycetota bacterium]